MRKEPIVTGEYYHVYNRGVDHRSTYHDDSDRERFVRGMIAFNQTTNIQLPLYRHHARPKRSHQPSVRIMAYALMPNHYHLLLQQLEDNGIATFMQKLGVGYAQYFNRRHERTGRLWESEYKAVRIETSAQMLHISRYIHLNPLKLFFPNWKTHGVPNWEVAQATLLSYPWSSYPHFLGREYDEAVDIGILADMFRDSDDYENFVKSWVVATVGN